MKITFICPPLNMSGGIRVIAIYAQQLQRAGHQVVIVSPPEASRTRWARLLQRIGLPAPTAQHQRHSHFDTLSVRKHRLPRPRSVREDDVPDADVIVATWWETAEWIAPMSERKGRKFYFVQHHEIFDPRPRARIEATYRLPLHKIVIAKWLATVMAQRYGDESASLVPNAVDRTLFFAAPRQKQQRPTIGTLFHETPFKGFDTTLAVLDEVRRRLGEVRIVAFGDSEPDKYRNRLVGVELTVRPPQSDIRAIYASCDVWLSCSRSEGFNLTAMEAMACRTPVVSTRTGWPEEAVRNGFNGALADVDDVPGLADGVVAVLSLSPQRWAETSENAARTVADSSWEASAKLFERVLSETVPDR